MHVSYSNLVQMRGNPKITIVDRLCKEVRHLVDSGIYRPGAKLPSVRDFAQKHGISPNTAAEVYDRLVSVNYLESRARVGYFVKNQADNTFTPANTPVLRADQAWRARPAANGANDKLNISTGRLPTEWRDSAPIKNALKALASRPDEDLLEYGDPHGHEGLRKLLQSRLLDMHIPVRMSQLLLTVGASQATDLVVRSLLRPGDTALIESPGYCALHRHLNMHGVKVYCIDRSEDGPDLLQLESLARTHQPKLFFIQSVLHSPTGSTVSLSKAHQLLKLAGEFHFMLVENDAYADLLRRYVPRLAALDPSKVIYIGSFSKTLSASARVGYLCAPEDLVFQLATLKSLTGISGTSLSEHLIFHTLSAGDYRRSLERLRVRLGNYMQLCCEALEQAGFILFCRPLGGKYLWVRHPAYPDARELSSVAAEHNISLAPGNSFQVQDAPSPWFRVNVAFANNHGYQQFLRSV